MDLVQHQTQEHNQLVEGSSPPGATNIDWYVALLLADLTGQMAVGTVVNPPRADEDHYDSARLSLCLGNLGLSSYEPSDRSIFL